MYTLRAIERRVRENHATIESTIHLFKSRCGCESVVQHYLYRIAYRSPPWANERATLDSYDESQSPPTTLDSKVGESAVNIGHNLRPTLILLCVAVVHAGARGLIQTNPNLSRSSWLQPYFIGCDRRNEGSVGCNFGLHTCHTILTAQDSITQSWMPCLQAKNVYERTYRDGYR